jgi:hypothetical protein
VPARRGPASQQHPRRPCWAHDVGRSSLRQRVHALADSVPHALRGDVPWQRHHRHGSSAASRAGGVSISGIALRPAPNAGESCCTRRHGPRRAMSSRRTHVGSARRLWAHTDPGTPGGLEPALPLACARPRPQATAEWFCPNSGRLCANAVHQPPCWTQSGAWRTAHNCSPPVTFSARRAVSDWTCLLDSSL